MIKFIDMADEHTELPRSLLVGSEKLVYCTYAWIETDEIVVQNDYQNRIPITVIDYKPKYSRRTTFVISNPIWDWIEDLRSAEEQREGVRTGTSRKDKSGSERRKQRSGNDQSICFARMEIHRILLPRREIPGSIAFG